MFTVTICSELIPQNILQLKLTYLVTFKYTSVKVVPSTYIHTYIVLQLYLRTYKLKLLLIHPPFREAFLPFYMGKKMYTSFGFFVIKQGIFM